MVRPTFRKLKVPQCKAHEKPSLYEIPYDTSDPANRFIPDREETLTLRVAFCLLEDLTAFCLKISLRFASRPHCVLLQDIYCVLLEDLTAFCLRTSLRFASRPYCVLLESNSGKISFFTAFCLGFFTAFCLNDIQAAGSDTRPPMLDRTDYESWSQRIRLYCRGKENGLQILQSIDQGPFELGTTRDA
ncbi:hypothetical protein Tco_0942555, partial [Tanacetum coccineum]